MEAYKNKEVSNISNSAPLIDDSTERAPDHPTVFHHSDAMPAAPPTAALDKNSSAHSATKESTTDRMVHSMKDAMHSIGSALGLDASKQSSTTTTTETSSKSSSSSSKSEIPPMQHVLHSEDEPVHSVRPLNESELPDETHMSHDQSLAKKAQAALNIVGHKIVEAKDSLVQSIHNATHKMPGDEPYINEQDEQFRLQMARDKARGAKQHDIEIVTPDGQHTVIDDNGQERTFVATAQRSSSLMEESSDFETFAPAQDNTSIPTAPAQKQSFSEKAKTTASHVAEVTSEKMHVAGQKISDAAIYAKERIVTEAAVVGGAIQKKATEWSHDASVQASQWGAKAKEVGHDASIKAKEVASQASAKTAEWAHQAKDVTQQKMSSASASIKQSTTEMASATKAKIADATGSNLEKAPDDLSNSPIKHVIHREDEPIRSVGFPTSESELPDETNMDHGGSIGKKIEHGAKLAARKLSATKDEIMKSVDSSHRHVSGEFLESDKQFHEQIHHDMLEASKHPKDVAFEMVLAKGQNLPVRDEFAQIDAQFQNRDINKYQQQSNIAAGKYSSQSGLLEEKTAETF